MLKRWLNKDKEMIISMAIGPIFATLLVCFISSGLYVENLPLAIANLDNSAVSRQIVSDFENHEGFTATLYVDSAQDLQDAVYEKKVVAGLLIPAGYGKSMGQGDGNTAMFLVDGTNQTISGAAQGYAAAIFETLNKGIQVKTLQAMGVPEQSISKMTGSFSFVERNLYDPRGSFTYNIIYMVIPYMIQMQMLCYFVFPLFWEERESGQLKLRGNSFMYYRLFFMSVLTAISTYLALIVGCLLFHIPFSSNFACHFVLMMAYIFALIAITFVISLFTTSKAKLYIFELFLIVGFLIMVTSGTIWPDFLTPKGFPALVRLIWPFAYVALPFKSLHLKNTGWAETLPAVGNCLLFGLVWLGIGIAICTWKGSKVIAQPAEE